MPPLPESLPDPIMFFFKYFWFFCALVCLLNTLLSKYFTGKSLKNSKFQAAVAGLNLRLVIPFTLLGIIQFLGGYESLLYILSGDFESLYFILTWIVIIGTWIYSACYILSRSRN